MCLTNINRQILATRRTVGRYKTEVAKERLLDINPDMTVNVYRTFYMPETAGQFDFTQYDYVVDAIDTVTGKIELVMNADKCGTPIICSMGAGNKVDPTRFEVADIYSTSVCPLARVMRFERIKRGIKKVIVVYSMSMQIRAVGAKGEADHPRGRHGDKLQAELRLPAGYSAKMHSTESSAGEQCVRAVGGGANYRRGGDQGHHWI